ncbi:hypothetical protein BKA65DRAFT_524893 [Rhexocercosporidium sp. MPI-PUGE-AT-0058]|nr:hypothetical protein BKA65DRAFT_524893 [Rhexocercosporidium sp. MPI-PUGE-AT-0058]
MFYLIFVLPANATLLSKRFNRFCCDFFGDFEGPINSLPCRSHWIIDLRTSYPGDNIRTTDDKTLVITPRFRNGAWTTARIETQKDFAAAPRGKWLIGARIKLGTAPASQQQGIWNAARNWQTESMTRSFDGQDLFVLTSSHVGDKPAWEKLAHDEHFLILNIEIGGNWPGPLNTQTMDRPSVAMEVDYVGIWSSI